MYRFTSLVILLFSLTACSSNYKLVAFGLYSNLGADSTVYNPHKIPESPVELAVIEAANSMKAVSVTGSDVMFTHQYEKAKYVSVVERSDEEYRFSEKKVVRYKVIDDKIAAKTGASSEFFTDIGFERAVVESALGSKALLPVLLYEDSNTTVGMVSSPMGDCAANVTIYSNPPSRDTPIAEKIVLYCF